MIRPWYIFMLPPESYYTLLISQGHQWANEPADMLKDFATGTAFAQAAPWYPTYLIRLADNPRTHMHALRRHYLTMRVSK